MNPAEVQAAASPGDFSPETAKCLEQAQTWANGTDAPQTHAAHLALALLSDQQGFLPPLLKELFNQLEAASVVDSLHDWLKYEFEDGAEEAPEEPPLADSARAVLARAATLAGEWGQPQIAPTAIACALCEQPDEFIVKAFADAGVTRAGLEKLAAWLAQGAQSNKIAAALPSLFQDGQLDFAIFGPVAQIALRMLAQLCAASPDRLLRDIDLIHCLLSQSDSLLAESLHLKGVNVAKVRQRLGMMVGNPAAGQAASRPAAGIMEDQMSRLLRGVFQRARELASREGCSLISESHLARAHMARVAENSANLYGQLGIDTVSLRHYLTRYVVDRGKVETAQPSEMVEDIEGYLRRRVINQDSAVQRVLPVLKRMRHGLSRPGKPLGVFMFLGATGVGKTELARAIADVVFGDKPGVKDPYLIRLDCGNFANEDAIFQMIGAPQMYKGYKEGQLTNALRDKPRAIILFDEAEKARSKVWQSLLPLFAEGLVREPDGTEYDATGCIIVLTSNLGYDKAMEKFDLWQMSLVEREKVQPEMEEFVWQQIRSYFSPEFLGRFGQNNVIFFNHFDLPSYEALASLQISKLIQEMQERFEIRVADSEVIKHLARLAWPQRAEGARPVERLINEHLVNQILAALDQTPERRKFSFIFLEGTGEIVLESQ